MNNFGLPEELGWRFDSLYQWKLSRKYPMTVEHIEIGGHTFQINKITDPTAALEEAVAANSMDSFATPYWAELWPSAHRVERICYRKCYSQRHSTVLELGCGMGLVGIVAGHFGASVVLNDREDDALRLAELNYLINLSTVPEVLQFDWIAPVQRQFSLILAADVVYELAIYQPLLHTFRTMLAPGGEIWLAEPNRPIAKDFFKVLSDNNFVWEMIPKKVTRNGRETRISVYIIRRK
ncbi:MAG: methyltransferase [Calditrichia bacterium]